MNRKELLQIAKPILFNTEMVHAIMDDRKTMTRRVIKPQPEMPLCYTFAGSGAGTWGYPGKNTHEYWGENYKRPDNLSQEDRVWKPPYHADDILYVRETWQHIGFAGEENGYVYKASENGKLWETETEDWIWRPSIHMPKEAARIFLKVTGVRVERLQDITEEGAKCEGANFRNGKNVGFAEKWERTAIDRFEEIWNSTIKKQDMSKYSWYADPWVWVITFERIEVDDR